MQSGVPCAWETEKRSEQAIRLEYLGTAASEGWPAVFCGCPACNRARELGGKNIRTRCQALIDGALLLDYPPDSNLHAILHGVRLEKITLLAVTHSHGDHWYPQELSLRQPPFCHPDIPLLKIFGNDKVKQGFDRVVKENSPLENSCEFILMKPFQQVEAENFAITALTAVHDRSEVCLNYLVTRDGKTILYAHDTGILPEDTWAFLSGKKLDLVSLDCNYQWESEGTNHMGLPDAVLVKKRMLEEGMADENTVFVVSHFSHGGGLEHGAMEELAAKEGFLTAYDGMRVEV